MSVGNPEIRHSLGLSYSQMGLLLSVFAWSYGLAQIPAGVAVDKISVRAALGAGLVLWSAAQIAAGFVTSLPQFLMARLALGLGKSPMYIGGTRVCTDWFAAKDRALPIAIFNSSSALAPALAPPLLTWLMLAFGWPTMFIIAGRSCQGTWLALYRSPADAKITPGGAHHPQHRRQPLYRENRFPAGAMAAEISHQLGHVPRLFGVVYLYWLYATWLPGYLETQRHLSIAKAGVISAIPLAAGFFGAVAGGIISNLLARKTSPISACRIPVMLGLFSAAALTIAATYAHSTWLAVTLISFGLFAINISSSCGWALAAVVTPPNTVATLEAIQNVGGSVGGSLAPLITGAIVQATGSFLPAFGLAGAIACASAIFYMTMTKRKIAD